MERPRRFDTSALKFSQWGWGELTANSIGFRDETIYLMSTTANRSESLALSRGEWDANLTAGDIQRATNRFYAWYDRLCAEGEFKPGHLLADAGKIAGRWKAVMDGPYAETKEAVDPW